jgi:hypothetical protein
MSPVWTFMRLFFFHYDRTCTKLFNKVVLHQDDICIGNLYFAISSYSFKSSSMKNVNFEIKAEFLTSQEIIDLGIINKRLFFNLGFIPNESNFFNWKNSFANNLSPDEFRREKS